MVQRASVLLLSVRVLCLSCTMVAFAPGGVSNVVSVVTLGASSTVDKVNVVFALLAVE